MGRLGRLEILGAELFCDGAGERGLFGTGVFRGDSFDQGEPGFFGRGGIVSNAARDDEEFAGVEEDVTAIGWGAANAKLAAEDEEHLVLMGVSVPWKFAMDAGHFDVLIVDLTNDSRRPKL
jgi:hypothetical protein